MKPLTKLSHYAIPKTCGGVTSSCPLAAVDLSGLMPKAWETRYTEILPDAADLLREDETGAYTPQGACTDGTYIYRALVEHDESATRLQKLRVDTGELVTQVTNTSYGHANDMCYAKGFLYIAHSSSTSIVYKVDAETLTLVDTFNVSSTIWGIDYDPEHDLFIVGSVGAAYFSVYYPDFTFMYRIKPQNPFYGMVRQGIACDVNYIYVALDNAYGAVIENEKGSRVMVYTWNGIFVKSIYIPIAEIEWAFTHNGFIYYGTYEGRDDNDVKHGKIYRTAFDLYPQQTVITGRPTDVSGGVNNLQRLPEGTPVRLWTGSVSTAATTFTLDSAAHGITVDENAPFRYLRFRFKGANQNVFDWYPANDGVPVLREFDITSATSDSNMRFREMRLTFDPKTQRFTCESNFVEQLFSDVSENTLKLTKDTATDGIELIQIWGIV